MIELTEHQQMSAFVIEKGATGLTVGRDIDKMGYKTVERSNEPDS